MLVSFLTPDKRNIAEVGSSSKTNCCLAFILRLFITNQRTHK